MRDGRRLVALDGLRGLAALTVVYGHAATITHLPAIPSGYAIDLFFLISGFVIAYAYEDKLLAGMKFARFFEARMVRIYPLYILGCAISVMLDLWLAAEAGGFWPLRAMAGQLPWAVTLLPQPRIEAEHSFLLNPPAWTLFLELVVNFAYAALVRRLTKRVIAIVALVAGAVLAGGAFGYGSLNFGTGGLEMPLGLARVVMTYSIGLLMYRHWREDRLKLVAVPGMLPVLLYLLLCFLLPAPRFAPMGVILIIATCAPMVWLALGSRSSGWPERILSWLGDLSYPLYALHIPVIQLLGHLGTRLGYTMAEAYRFAAIAAIPLAWLSIAAYDAPVRAWLGRRLKLRRAVIEAARGL